MLAPLDSLYQEIVREHAKAPRNRRRIDGAAHARGDNPMCGDRVDVFLAFDPAGTISDAAFEAKGCAICIASASLMTEAVRGMSRAAARALSEGFRAWARSGERPAGQPDALAPLAAVHAYPSRIRCATLPWTTLEAVLDGKGRASSE
jgi:nitrogen fixation NifU-like protein